MRGSYGQLEIDELTEETLEFLGKGSLGDHMRAYEKFKSDTTADKQLLEKLHAKIKKSYSAKFMRGVSENLMFNEELQS